MSVSADFDESVVIGKEEIRPELTSIQKHQGFVLEPDVPFVQVVRAYSLVLRPHHHAGVGLDDTLEFPFPFELKASRPDPDSIFLDSLPLLVHALQRYQINQVMQ